MTPVTYVVPTESTSPRFGRAFAAGCGGQLTTADTIVAKGPVALFGSPARWPLILQAMREHRLIYADHAYFNKARFTHFRITRNAWQHDGRGLSSNQRFARLGLQVQPWRTNGTRIVICPNSDNYFRLYDIDPAEWMASVRADLATWSDRPLHVRWKAQALQSPLADDLTTAWAVVTFSSASAVEALMAGVPVFALAPFAAAARMGLSDLSQIERPFYPTDREQFLWNLASQQWTLDEVAAGDAWRSLNVEGHA